MTASASQDSRLVVYDMRSQTSQVAAILNLALYTKVGLGAVGAAGRFVLMGSRVVNGVDAWDAYLFQIGTTARSPGKGRRAGSG